MRSIFSTEELAISYGSSIVLEDLSLSIPTAAFTVLVGPNGSGKSTLLRALSGFLKPTEGTVLLEGNSIANLSTRELALRLGILSQGPATPEGMTVSDLVRQGRYPHRSLFSPWSEQDSTACDEALSLTGMTDMKNRMIDHLSGGQRQRAWIAMTLAQQTPVLLLDEPTTFLDLSHQIEVMDLVTSLVRQRGKTVVAILHDLNQSCRHADFLVMLNSGGVIASGSPEQVVTPSSIKTVFGVDAKVLPDPVTGTPMCIPVPASQTPRIPRQRPFQPRSLEES